MKVQDIMTKSIVSLNKNDTIEAAANIMKEHNIGSVPVCEENNVTGIITDRDIVLRSVASGQNYKSQSIKDVMSKNPITGSPEMSIDDASKIMSENQIRRLPIVDNNNLVGMLALGDLAVRSKLNEEAEQALSSISEPSTPAY